MIDDQTANAQAAAARSGRTMPRIKGTDPRVKSVTDRIGRGRMAADNAAEAVGRRPSDADINDDFAKRLMVAQQAETPRAGKVKRTSIRGRGQVASRWDDDPNQYRYHYSPEENFEGIRREGFRPDLKKGFSQGTHFMDDPNAYPAIGDDPMNVYRVRRDAVPDWQNVSSDDYYTRRPIAANDVDVYTGTPEMPGTWGRVNNAYGVGGGVKGLYDIVSSFMPGTLPQIQTPADWVIQDVLRNLDASPWNPENTMGARTLA
jgi:hypothetical protein